MFLEERDIDALRRRLRRSCGGWPWPDVEDAIQDALASLLQRSRSGKTIEHPIAYCAAAARRRLLDRHRRQAPIRGIDLDSLPAAAATPPQDWVRDLEDIGLSPRAAWSEVLACIAAGLRSSRRIAQVLGRDVTSIRERRERLRRWLAKHAPPPRRLCLW